MRGSEGGVDINVGRGKGEKKQGGRERKDKRQGEVFEGGLYKEYEIRQRVDKSEKRCLGSEVRRKEVE